MSGRSNRATEGAVSVVANRPNSDISYLFSCRRTEMASLHEPAVAYHQRLPGQRIRLERGEEQRRLGDVLDRGELAIDRVLEHDVLDHVLFGDSERFRLLGDLLVHERRAHEAGADDVGPDAVLRAFLGDDFREPKEALLRRDVRAFQPRGLLEMTAAHTDHAAADARRTH